ncbi:MAG: sulfatase [Verrucomicrobiota bacterium]
MRFAPVLLATLVGIGPGFLVPFTISAEDRPNVLMISVDDLNDWTGYLAGHPDVKTPHLDALAASGRNFANAHCAIPVCSPSRVSVMSGVAATTHGSYELGPAYQDLPALENIPCLQEYFKANGYTTITGGKVLHHGFTGRLAEAIDRTLHKGKGGPRPKDPINWDLRSWDWGPYPETDDEMYDQQLARLTAQALQESYEKPFFMSIGLFRPHVPLYVPPHWFEKYDQDTIQLPRNPLSDLDDVPPNFIGLKQIAPSQAEVLEMEAWRPLVQAYLASVTFVDHCLGIIMEGLEKSPHRDNTLVVLWSDHGFHLGEKQHWAKRTLWEESTRVPLLFAGPGIDPGEPCQEAVSLIDIYPTLVELCDLPVPDHLEGLSLMPQLNDPTSERTQPAIISSYFGNHAIRTRNWRYIRYADGAEELYHHATDPDEFHNLATDPHQEDRKAQLAQWLPKNPAPEFKEVSEQDPRSDPRNKKKKN